MNEVVIGPARSRVMGYRYFRGASTEWHVCPLPVLKVMYFLLDQLSMLFHGSISDSVPTTGTPVLMVPDVTNPSELWIASCNSSQEEGLVILSCSQVLT